jgi:heavy metal sensor kinase
MSSKLRRILSFRIGLRVALWFTLGTIGIAVVLFATAYVLISRSIHEANRTVALNKLEQYTQVERRHGLDALLTVLRSEHVENERSGFFIRLLDDEGDTLFLTLPRGYKDPGRENLEQRRITTTKRWVMLRPSETGDAMEVTAVTLSRDVQLEVGFGLAEERRVLGYFTSIFPLMALPLLALGLVGGVFMANRALSPIRDLSRAVARVEAGGFDARVPMPATNDELHELAGQFNRMIGHIESLIQGMRNTLDNVAHDLRTPLMRMRAGVEDALQHEERPELLREALMDCAEEAERINRMTSTLMDISEAESGALRLNLVPCDLHGLAAEAVDLYQLVAEEKGVVLSLESVKDDGALALADADRVRQVLANLLDNALKYTPQGGRVRVRTRRDDAWCELKVADTGTGIDPEDMPHIFDRLYRGDKSRSQRGLGLGLSLVRAVVQAHGGRIEVDSAPGKGAVFTVRLPAGKADELGPRQV